MYAAYPTYVLIIFTKCTIFSIYPEGKSDKFDICEGLASFLLKFYNRHPWKIYLEAYITNNTFDTKIILHNYILYYAFRAEEQWNFSSITKDGSDIYRCFNRKLVLTMCIAANLWISGASLSKLENVTWLFLIKCIGCLCMPPNIFSHGPPL